MREGALTARQAVAAPRQCRAARGSGGRLPLAASCAFFLCLASAPGERHSLQSRMRSTLATIFN